MKTLSGRNITSPVSALTVAVLIPLFTAVEFHLIAPSAEERQAPANGKALR
ncbi:MAG: hypothetical protein LBB14_00495 [Puniceicoccales bacterium]|nr:hypothetical protein [Puniceicoccales bacterium]